MRKGLIDMLINHLLWTRIEREKILKLLKEKDTDNSLSAFLDKRIKEIAKE